MKLNLLEWVVRFNPKKNVTIDWLMNSSKKNTTTG